MVHTTLPQVGEKWTDEDTLYPNENMEYGVVTVVDVNHYTITIEDHSGEKHTGAHRWFMMDFQPHHGDE